MTSLKRKRLSLLKNIKGIIELESITKPWKVAKKYGVPRNTLTTWLLPGSKGNS